MMVDSNHQDPSDFIKSLEKERQRAAAFYATLSEIQKYCRQLAQQDLPPIWAQNKIGSDTTEHFKEIMVDHFAEIYIRFDLTPQSSVFDLGLRLRTPRVSIRAFDW